MSYPAPPPPGQGGSTPNPYQANPYAPGGGSPYGQPPKKDNSTLWWILGGVAVVIVICICGVCAFFGFVANEASDGISSASSSVDNAKAENATVVDEGEEVTDNGATVRPGWQVTATDDLSGVMIRNDGTSRDMKRVTFFFIEDGNVLEDATCSTDFLDPGETDYAPTCMDPISSIDGYDEIRVAEGT